MKRGEENIASLSDDRLRGEKNWGGDVEREGKVRQPRLIRGLGKWRGGKRKELSAQSLEGGEKEKKREEIHDPSFCRGTGGEKKKKR